MQKLMHSLGILIAFTPYTYAQSISTYKAVIIVPVADLVGSPIKNMMKVDDVYSGYQNLPHSSTSEHRAACPRMHQILFNEMVEVLQEEKDEVKVSVSTAFYTIEGNKAPQKTYWVLKKHLMPLASIKNAAICVPSPIDFTMPESVISSDTVSLLHPVYDSETKMTFSAGTRFILSKRQPHDATKIHAMRYNPITQSPGLLQLERASCIMTSTTSTQQTRIVNFVRIVQGWAKSDTGIIPYVLGGTSFCTRLADIPCSAQPLPTNPSQNCYIRDKDKNTPKCGMDCSGLIIRAAHMAGIPYFLKNTKTISTHLKPLTHKEKLEPGDLVVIPGHVIIISDTEKNLVVEARSYEHGYGKIHELPIGKVFNGIATLDALVEAHHAGKSVDRLDSNGTIRDHFPRVTLMRMKSAWDIYHP